MSANNSVGSLHFGLRKFQIIEDPNNPRQFYVEGMRIADFALACKRAHNGEGMEMSINQTGVGIGLRFFQKHEEAYCATINTKDDPPVQVKLHESGGKVFVEIRVLRN